VALSLGGAGCREGDPAGLVEQAQEERAELQQAREALQQAQTPAARQEAQRKVAEELREVLQVERDVAQASPDSVALAPGDVSLQDGGIVLGPPRAGSITGSVLEASEGGIALRDESGRHVRLEVDLQTRVTDNGRTLRVEQLREGTSVRARFDVEGNAPVARQVEILGTQPPR
jgi:hypothetical protein